MEGLNTLVMPLDNDVMDIRKKRGWPTSICGRFIIYTRKKGHILKRQIYDTVLLLFFYLPGQ